MLKCSFWFAAHLRIMVYLKPENIALEDSSRSHWQLKILIKEYNSNPHLVALAVNAIRHGLQIGHPKNLPLPFMLGDDRHFLQLDP